MTNPSDRVTYGDLRMVPAEFDELMQLSVDAGTLKHPVSYATYVDDSFAKAGQPAPILLWPRACIPGWRSPPLRCWRWHTSRWRL
jgi:hypothetical protein